MSRRSSPRPNGSCLPARHSRRSCTNRRRPRTANTSKTPGLRAAARRRTMTTSSTLRSSTRTSRRNVMPEEPDDLDEFEDQFDLSALFADDDEVEAAASVLENDIASIAAQRDEYLALAQRLQAEF